MGRYFIDFYPCEGGASVGYQRALGPLDVTVVGVDLWKDYDRARYPFPGLKGGALEALDRLTMGETLRFWDRAGYPVRVSLEDVVGAAASPPCQRYSAGTRTQDPDDYPDLVGPTRDRLRSTGLPYIIENVVGAPLEAPTLLCGSMFGLATPDEDGFPLRLERHRLFEANFPIHAPGPCAHDPEVWVAGVYGGARGRKRGQTPSQHRMIARHERRGGYVPASLEVRQRLLGITWASPEGMAQAIPPAYTEHLGGILAAHLTQEHATA